MKEFNLQNEIDKLIEEKVYKNLEMSGIVVKYSYTGSDYFKFFIDGEFRELKTYNKNDRSETVKESFQAGNTIYFFRDLLEFCKWYIKYREEE